MKVELFHIQDCPNTEPARMLLREILRELGQADEISEVEVFRCSSGGRAEFSRIADHTRQWDRRRYSLTAAKPLRAVLPNVHDWRKASGTPGTGDDSQRDSVGSFADRPGDEEIMKHSEKVTPVAR